MQRLHGSVAKLVNDLLTVRLTPFWYDTGRQSDFDGCIRDEVQARRAYKYILRQSVRHGIARDWTKYLHTRVKVDLDRAVKRSLELKAFLTDIPYERYRRKRDGDAPREHR
jgi:hypothetical protein